MAFVRLRIMANELCFNICHFPLSFKRNSDVERLADLADANISHRLRYASYAWTRYVVPLKHPSIVLSWLLSDFFCSHFLYWLEIMSITGGSVSDALEHLELMEVSSK